jgi:hypothetical protein
MKNFAPKSPLGKVTNTPSPKPPKMGGMGPKAPKMAKMGVAVQKDLSLRRWVSSHQKQVSNRRSSNAHS